MLREAFRLGESQAQDNQRAVAVQYKTITKYVMLHGITLALFSQGR